MEKGKDLLTEEFFVKRRSNQKFANASNRIRYNNLKARKKRTAKASIDRKLDRNRTILQNILGTQKEVKVSKDYLLGSGFSFGYFSYQKMINNVMYFGIYEYGITSLGNNSFTIIRIFNG